MYSSMMLLVDVEFIFESSPMLINILFWFVGKSGNLDNLSELKPGAVDKQFFLSGPESDYDCSQK